MKKPDLVSICESMSDEEADLWFDQMSDEQHAEFNAVAKAYISSLRRQKVRLMRKQYNLLAATHQLLVDIADQEKSLHLLEGGTLS